MKTVKISSFLKERKIKLKPQAANCSGLQRIEKIDFSGKIYLSPVQTNTDMILIKSGDLVISGINVEKGALAIYTSEEDVLASIHYSAYEFDAEKIDIDYLKWFLKSNIFRKLLLKQTESGIKKEIKAKHLLPIEIQLPSLNWQHEIVRQIQGVANYIEEVNRQIQQQAEYAEMLRQSILQQAVEGKLCEQDPNDEPASVLLKKIKAEKERLITEKKIKKQKPLPPISEEEKTLVLPKGWEWCRVGTLCESSLGKMLDKKKNKGQLRPYLRNLNVQWFKFNLSDVLEMRFTDEEKERYTVKYGDVVICEGGYPGMGAIWENTENIYFQKALHRNRFFFEGMNYYFLYYLYSIFYNSKLKKYYTGMGIQHLTGKSLANIPIPVPPLAELQRIVKKVEILFQLLDKLEQEISNAKLYASDLIEAVLQEAFSVQETAKPAQVIEFHPDQTIPETELLAAARGKIREDTWEHLCKRALEIVGEES